MSTLEPSKTSPSNQLVEQRIRNRIYEYLCGVIEYPIERGCWDLNELINEWEIFVDDPFNSGQFPSPAFSGEEVIAMSKVHEAWLEFASATPQNIKDEAAAMATHQWSKLLAACSMAESIFAVRGRISEDESLTE